MKRIVLSVAACMLLAQPVFAGGFFIGEQGARAEGMGGAFTGLADDPSALWFNPAGIAFQEGISGTAGFDVLMPTNKFTPATGVTYTANKKTFVTPQGYLVYNTDALPVALGLGINTPFGLSTDWRNTGAPFTATGTPALFPATVTFSQIEMLNFNPSVAYRINDKLSIAVGATYYYVNKVHLDNQILLLGGNGDGWGGNVAVMYKDGPVGFGVSYRSRVKAKINGTAIGAGPLAAAGSTSASTSVTFPDMVNVGLSYRLSDAWLLSADVDWVNWKTFDKITVNYVPSTLTGALGATTSTIPENWKATTSFRLGAEWDFAANMRARVGYVYDPSPINAVDFSPRLPGNDRQLFNIGYGYDLGKKTTIDLAYSYVLLNNRNQTASAAPFYNGTYKSDVHIVAASLTHHF
ncbi:MAG TPA: outer membrane protein transport protein [Mariprofundaceae bacterium]|nr:outer membrane protein transport protein [Mariprofundaceae bacterium]